MNCIRLEATDWRCEVAPLIVSIARDDCVSLAMQKVMEDLKKSINQLLTSAFETILLIDTVEDCDRSHSNSMEAGHLEKPKSTCRIKAVISRSNKMDDRYLSVVSLINRIRGSKRIRKSKCRHIYCRAKGIGVYSRHHLCKVFIPCLGTVKKKNKWRRLLMFFGMDKK